MDDLIDEGAEYLPRQGVAIHAEPKEDRNEALVHRLTTILRLRKGHPRPQCGIPKPPPWPGQRCCRVGGG